MATTLPPVMITATRWPQRDAAALLEQFIFGARYSGRRAPRGIDPEYVSYWIRTQIKPDAAPSALLRVVDLLRFYDRRDVIDVLAPILTRREADDRDLARSAYVLQALGEVGTAEHGRVAANYLNEFLVPVPAALTLFPLMLETAEALALHIDMEPLTQRLKQAIVETGTVPNLKGPAGIPHRKYSDYQRNELPQTQLVVTMKRRVELTEPAIRFQELVFIYMGEADLSTASTHVWAGRLLRSYAMLGETQQQAVLDIFKTIMDGAIRSRMVKPRKDFTVGRAAQATIYLQGKLSFQTQDYFDSIQNRPESFLSDE